MASTHRTRRLPLVALALAVALAACSDADLVGPVTALEDLAGNWKAVRMDAANPLQPGSTIELVSTGVQFFINIQPSGLYTATLTFDGGASTEIGRLVVDGDEIVLNREYPSLDVSRAAFTLTGDVLIISGETEFPVGEGVFVTTTVEIELHRQVDDDDG
jgi:hypothetical protein